MPLGASAHMAVVLDTADEIPEHLRSLECDGWHVDVHKSTYPANNPSEDRSSLVFTEDDSIFTGVWDGHGMLAPPLLAYEYTRPVPFASNALCHDDIRLQAAPRLQNLLRSTFGLISSKLWTRPATLGRLSSAVTSRRMRITSNWAARGKTRRCY
eukprot:COSAG05_NODE_442_length_9803_cov_28.091921_8_plen_155_part_00